MIREHCTIHRGSPKGAPRSWATAIFSWSATHLGHNCVIGNGVVIANDCLLAGHVRIDDRAFIGGGSRFHQGIRMGRLVMAEGRFTKNLPPFLSAAKNEVYGMNIVGLRRADFSAAERDEIKRAFKLLYRSGLNTKQALEKAAETEFGPIGREFFDFVANAGQARDRFLRQRRRGRGLIRSRYACKTRNDYRQSRSGETPTGVSELSRIGQSSSLGFEIRCDQRSARNASIRPVRPFSAR